MHAPSPQHNKIPARRWRIGWLLGIGILVNYFDRISLSVAAPQLQQEFGLSNGELGLLFSAFFWSYALLQIPTGVILDRFGTTRIGRLGALLWGVAATLTACAGGFAGIFAARMLLGVAEAPGFPVSSKATGYWFPRRERAMATAIFDAAAKFSNVIGVPLVALAVVHLGWRWGFGVSAILSVLYFIAFYLIYRDPSADTKLSEAERQYIVQGGAAEEGVSQQGSMAMLGYLLRQRKVWGLSIGFAAYGYVFYLFLTWLPGYLVQSMHMDILKSAWFSAIPWMFATLSDLFVGGWLIDKLIERGYDETKVRKAVLLCGMAMGMAVFGATTTSDPYVAIVWITIALSGLAAAAPVGWSLPSLIAPRGGTGTVGGIMNFANNMMGAVAPIVTGFIVGATHSFANAFLVAGFMLVIGILAFVFLLGRIEPLPEPGVSPD
ncbi:MFS transporter [Chromobacterium violaceum]|uniref:D-galactonate transporter n=2 Tax=Chromobacterium violaceum TaxID=536 RepID=Q7NTU5_CHRVO|nr:MFS transporter [Chromobacterium violaceum]AAQ60626.1 D-galactonate transporter [Chromobacterium violaceum ATCC 12472]KMN47888.1 MFS transporter [Chromobacterium violaceum]KMN86616.1 MFS transporter [Chromobacterium violaceum]KMN92107.1 MFS transporter [Chromobacterium violaceum]KMO04150.1 MFS transporter [Chromobacterium violaceum]